METPLTEVITPERTRDGRGHRLYTDARRDEIIAAYRQSGLTQIAFARREGVKYSTFTAWLQGRRATSRSPAAKRLRVGSSTPVRFVEAQLPSLSSPALEVQLPDGTRLRGSNARELASLVHALRR